MKKGKVARLAGFIGALGVSTVLVTMAVQGTGAYFTSSVDGNLNGTSGHLSISVPGGAQLTFTGLNPGQDQTKPITFHVDSTSTTNADVWMVFDPNSANYGRFTGNKTADYNGYTGGGLGMYGHFKVTGIQGHAFESYNLQLVDADDATKGYDNGSCHVTDDGNGGSQQTHADGQGNDVSECGVPAAIKLATNVAPGSTNQATVVFGLTGKQTNQDQVNEPNVNFHIVATQPGEYPLTSAGTVGSNW